MNVLRLSRKATTVACLLIVSCCAVAQVTPSRSITPLQGFFNPSAPGHDKWNIIVESGEEEEREINRIDPEIQKVQEEKTRLKLAGLGAKFKNNMIDPDKYRYDTAQVKHSFAGIVSSAIPFDNGTAVGNGRFVVHSVNSLISIRDTSGQVLYNNNLSSFFGVSKTISDPRVIYDSYADRFIVLAIPVDQCVIYIAFAAGSDPTAGWHRYTQTIPGEISNHIYDYPFAGITEHDLVISGSVFPPSGSGSVHPHILQISKRDGYNGASLHVNDYKLPTTQNYSLCVVNHGSPTIPYGNRSYLVSDIRSSGGGDALILYTLTDTTQGNPQLLDRMLEVPHYAPAGYVPQKGTSFTLRPTDTRVMSAVYADNTIHLVQHADIDNSGYHSLNYYRLRVDSFTTRRYTFSKPQTDLCFPSVSLFSDTITDRSVLLAFQESSTQIYPGFSAIICNHDGSWTLPVTVKAGEGRILTQRWGDYSSCTRRHNAATPTAWISGEYGAAGSVRACWVAEITATPKRIPEKPAPVVHVTHKLYPNPVWGERWKLEFYLPVEQFVNISIYDALGQLVKTLYDGPLAAGDTRLTFEKSALAAGWYAVRVSVPEKILYTDKIIVR